jgi:hypothetical protein
VSTLAEDTPATPTARTILGTPVHVLDVTTIDGERPFIQVGFTREPVVTVVVQNRRAGRWQQSLLQQSIRIALAQLVAATSAVDPTESQKQLASAVASLPIECMSALRAIGVQLDSSAELTSRRGGR